MIYVPQLIFFIHLSCHCVFDDVVFNPFSDNLKLYFYVPYHTACIVIDSKANIACYEHLYPDFELDFYFARLACDIRIARLRGRTVTQFSAR
jgi:hypothetical protein